MTVDKIIPCICCEHPPSSVTGPWDYGMPILIPHNAGEHRQLWDARCPNCGRGGFMEEKSAYLALKKWNSIMESLYELDGKPIIYEEEWKDTCNRLGYTYHEW